GGQAAEVRAALAALGGKEDLCRQLAQFAIEEAPDLMRQIEQSLAERDAITLERAAHKLRGSVRYFQAERVAELAGGLESRARRQDFEPCGELVEQLKPAMERLLSVLVDYTGAPGSPTN
ncbi:MAG: Hpt domain-containing protein, partial [Pirellulaceae bacterium]|nr:Hpt domain-containing protein [Pirellulaceae bacterium]